MEIRFYGAAETVTGSKHLLSLDDGQQILLDCGLFQEEKHDAREKNKHFGFSPSKVNQLILSHAHIDHSGLIAKLVKEGFRGNIFCTPATYDLCRILLEDSGKIQEFETEELNEERQKQNLPPIAPLYTKEDAKHCMKYFKPVPFNKSFRVSHNIHCKFIDNGHLLGSAGVFLTLDENKKTHRLFFTGDIGRKQNLLLQAPQPFPQADTLICESTYGDRLHTEVQNTKNNILEIIQDTCIQKKGKLLIPAFSVGRTQELLFLFHQLYQEGQLPDVPIYVDSPLAIKATQLHDKHSQLFNNKVKRFIQKHKQAFRFQNVEMLKKPKASKKLNYSKSPAIIIAGAGMMHAGRIIHHFVHHINDPKNTILVVGFCAEGTLGREIVERKPEVKIFDKPFKVRANVIEMDDFSSHADYKEMLQYLSCQEPSKVGNLFLVHGNKEAFPFFKDQLKGAGFQQVHIAQQGKPYQL